LVCRCSSGFFSGSPKSRRQAAVIQKLADMIGYNVKLYDMTLQFLRTLFLRTRNVHYCTLRSELLMALHDRWDHTIVQVKMLMCVRCELNEFKKEKNLGRLTRWSKFLPFYLR
jgi:hypothetical protein